MKKLALTIALVSMTCGQPGADPNNPNNPNNPNQPGDPISSLDSPLKNGSRLRNKYVSGADGTIALASSGGPILDSERNEDCAFTLADDGLLHCMPVVNTTALVNYFYAATCTGSVVAVSDACAPAAKYVYLPKTNCGAAVGPTLANVSEITAPTMVYMKNGASCTAVSNPYYGTGYRSYTVGTTIAASSFVSGTIMTQ